MPTSRNTCDDGGEAASQIDSDGGTMLGQMPSTSPAKPSTKKHRVSTNGDASRPSCIAARHSANAFTNASRSAEHTSELQSLMRISYVAFRLNRKRKNATYQNYE